MSKVVVTEKSTKRRLLDLPYEIVFEIFRGLPKDKAIELSRLCSKLRDIARDTRFWKDVYIKYEPTFNQYACDELYSGPWPVKAIDMSYIWIKPPVSPKINQIVKVTRLNLSSIRVDEVTMKFIWSKYQCKELYLDLNYGSYRDHVEIAPEAFSNQTALEFLSLKDMHLIHFDETRTISRTKFCRWLASVLSNCKNLKTLNLCNREENLEMLNIVRTLPTSLEKLCLADSSLEDSFFKLLAARIPNLRVLGFCDSSVQCRSLLDFQFLEVLYITRVAYPNVTDLFVYFEKFSALKAIYVNSDKESYNARYRGNVEQLRTALEPHGIAVGFKRFSEWPPCVKDGNVLKVSNAT